MKRQYRVITRINISVTGTKSREQAIDVVKKAVDMLLQTEDYEVDTIYEIEPSSGSADLVYS